METLLSHLLTIAKNHPKRIALRCGAEAVPYGEFRVRILMAAARLRALGVGEGEPVLLCAGNTPAIPVLYFAVHALGAVAVPIGPETPENVLASWRRIPRRNWRWSKGRQRDSLRCGFAGGHNDRTTGHKEKIQPCAALTPSPIFFTLQEPQDAERSGADAGEHPSGGTEHHRVRGNGPEDVEIVPLPLSHSFGLGRLRCLAVTAILWCWSPVSARECHS